MHESVFHPRYYRGKTPVIKLLHLKFSDQRRVVRWMAIQDFKLLQLEGAAFGPKDIVVVGLNDWYFTG